MLRSRIIAAGIATLRLITDVAAAARPGAARRPPAQRSVLDDVAVRRPWNLVVKAARLRARARRRLRSLIPGVTVIIVNWNTREVTADVVRAVQRFSPRGTALLLIDNGSTDGSRELFSSWPGVRTMLLRSNAGHGVALDLGLCAIRTTLAVTLDSDAIPLRAGWLDPVITPLAAGTALIAGLRSRRDFVHPVFLGLDAATFLERRLSFQVHRVQKPAGVPDRWGVDAWDTGELLSREFLPSEVHFVDLPSEPAPEPVGATTGGLLYHHGGVSRDGSGGVSREALQEWRRACHALGL